MCQALCPPFCGGDYNFIKTTDNDTGKEDRIALNNVFGSST